MCADAGLLRLLLAAYRAVAAEGELDGLLGPPRPAPEDGGASAEWDVGPLLHAIQALGGHSLPLPDLRAWTEACAAAETHRSGRGAVELMVALERAVASEEAAGPACTFELDGESSGLLGPGESRWPFASGYAVVTWLYVESFADTVGAAATAAAIAAAATARVGRASAVSAAAAASALAGEGLVHMPRLFSFLTGESIGVEAFFHGQFLVVEAAGGGGGGGSKGGGKRTSLHFAHAFQPRRWYFVGLEHSAKQSLLAKNDCEIRLYVDGKFSEAKVLELPRPSKPLAFCCIGTNPPAAMAGLQRRRRQCPLFAEMGPVYIFKEPIGGERMARLAARGGDYLPCFGAGAGAPCHASSEQLGVVAEESAALDLELAPALHLLYHPRLLTGRLCPDASPAGAAGTPLGPRPLHLLIALDQSDNLAYSTSLQPPEASTSPSSRAPDLSAGTLLSCPLIRHTPEACGGAGAVRQRATWAIWTGAPGGSLALLPMFGPAPDRATDAAQPLAAPVSLAASILRILALLAREALHLEELARWKTPALLSHLLGRFLSSPDRPADVETEAHGSPSTGKVEDTEEELVSAVLALAQAPQGRYPTALAIRRELYASLLLDLALWARCSYGLQKKLLSQLADLAFAEQAIMHSANALQMLLDSCRRCYWVVREEDSIDFKGGPQADAQDKVGSGAGCEESQLGEAQALVDELLVVVELLVGPANQGPAAAEESIRTLVQFAISCPQPHQVARVLQLMYRLIVQPNSARSKAFAELLLATGAGEMLLALLRSEGAQGEASLLPTQSMDALARQRPLASKKGAGNQVQATPAAVIETEPESKVDVRSTMYSTPMKGRTALRPSVDIPSGQWPTSSKAALGGISLSISASSARANFCSGSGRGDDVVAAVVALLGALAVGGLLNFQMPLGEWILVALEKALQRAPQRLLTSSVYESMLKAVLRSEAWPSLPRSRAGAEDKVCGLDVAQRFEQPELLGALLRALPYASPGLQLRALQDLLLLACMSSRNRQTLVSLGWPELLLELLLLSHEEQEHDGDGEGLGLASGDGLKAVQELVYSFLAIMLEHSMREKDGWKDVENTLHSLEWLTYTKGAALSTERRLRWETAVPTIKRHLLGALLDFAAVELDAQAGLVAATAAGVASENLSPRAARAEVDIAAQLSLSLAENALVLLALIEEFLRIQCQVTTSNRASSVLANGALNSPPTPSAARIPALKGYNSRSGGSKSFNAGVPLEVLASMADSEGQISAASMDRVLASATAEPWESVRSALTAYGSTGLEMGPSWTRRSRMWFGVGLEQDSGGGGDAAGWESWHEALQRDDDGQWTDYPLVQKAVRMLMALLSNAMGSVGGGAGGAGGVGGGGGRALGGGGGGGAGTIQGLQQLVDSDQPFYVMLRLVLVALREEDHMIEGKRTTAEEGQRERGNTENGASVPVSQMKSQSDAEIQAEAARRAKTSLLWGILAPLLTMPLVESRRQRVLVTACIMYTEVWHAIAKDGKVLRKQLVEAIVPPLTALLRRWRPMLSGMHEFTDLEGCSPLALEDRALATDALPCEAALALVGPAWASAFASPPAAAALAVAAAGTAAAFTPTDESTSIGSKHITESVSSLKVAAGSVPEPDKLRKSYSHLIADYAGGGSLVGPSPSRAMDKAMSSRREQERKARIGTGRGLGAVAMATSCERRTQGNLARVTRWNRRETIDSAWDVATDDAQSLARLVVDKPEPMASLPSIMRTVSSMKEAELRRRAGVAAKRELEAAIGARMWRRLLRRLTEARCLYSSKIGEENPEQRAFWKLDPTENSQRMRRRLKRTYKVLDHKGAAADQQEIRVAASLPSNIPMEGPALQPEQSPLDNSGEGEVASEGLEGVGGGPSDDGIPRTASDKGSLEDGLDAEATAQRAAASTSTEAGAAKLAAAAVSTVAEGEDAVILEQPAALIQPLQILRGCFQVRTKSICFLIDDRVAFTETGVASIELKDDWEMVHHEGEDGDSGRCNGDGGEVSPGQRRSGARHLSWPMSSVCEVHSRRYLLQKSALEFFMLDRSNFFFNYTRPERLLRRSQLTERWVRREISNFEYLMQLNTLAGRTYNDITQYPVFPWVIADYTSKELDLDNPATFRDLSKPIGAQQEARLAKFVERYESFDDPIIPKFHYGSHYSSAGIVLYYLVRIEPYTSLAIHLQGGSLDHADRLFSDVSATWDSVLTDMSDVKELVPECFYLPEMFGNVNNIDLGTTQKGDKLGDVKLPPWAHDNTFEFVQKQAKALESDFVSAHLHQWIDLIFGFKQRGSEAVTAQNVFFYMTYEGAVDIDKITDSVQRKATQDQIAYFGQTPSQLLTTPHPARMTLVEAFHQHTIFCTPASLKEYSIPQGHQLNMPAGRLAVTASVIVAVDNQVAMHKWKVNTPDGKGAPFIFNPKASSLTRSSSGAFMRIFGKGSSSSDQSQSLDSPAVHHKVVAHPAPEINRRHIVAICPDGKHMFLGLQHVAVVLAGGHADNTVKLVAVDTARVLESASAHVGPVTCLSLSSDGSILITGSQDCTLIVWRVQGRQVTVLVGTGSIHNTGMVGAAAAAAAATTTSFGSSQSPSTKAQTPSSDHSLDLNKKNMDGPLHFLRGHRDALTSCVVHTDLDLVASSSSSRGVLLHTIMTGQLLQALQAPPSLSLICPDLLALSPQGVVAAWVASTSTMHTFSVNGVHLKSTIFPASTDGTISAMEVSRDGLHMVVGTDCTSNIESIRRTFSQGLPPRKKVLEADASVQAQKPNAHPQGLDESFQLSSRQDEVMKAANSSLPKHSEIEEIISEEPEPGALQRLAGQRSTSLRDWMVAEKVLEEEQLAEARPTIMFLDLQTLEVLHRLRLPRWSHVTSLALTSDNSNLLISTADAKLLLYTDPNLSLKLVDEMLRLGWEGSGLASFLS
eukprot:SM000226S07410  [mRNA]  locus=s226:160492:175617:+ [translate_table: standard]